MICKRLEKRSRSGWVVVRTQMRKNKWAEQPSPDCSLMLGSVTCARAASIVALIIGVARREASQTVVRKQVPSARIYDSTLLLRCQRAFRQRNREDLIGPERGIAWLRTVNHVKAVIRRMIPKARKPLA